MPVSLVQKRTAAIALVLVPVIVAAWWFVRRPARRNFDASPSEEVLRARAEQQANWSRADFVLLGQSTGAAGGTVANAQQEAVRRAVRDAIEDPDSLASPQQVEALVTVLERQVRARGTKSAEAYAEAAAALECSRFITPADEKEWMVVNAFSTEGLKLPLADGNQPQVLKKVAEYCLEGQDAYFRAVGSGPGGASVRMFRVRSEPEVIVKATPKDPLDQAYWFGATHGALMLRVPMRRLRDVLIEERSALCASVLMLVEVAQGRRYTWHSVWFWDSKNNCWACHMMSRTGGTHGYWMFY